MPIEDPMLPTLMTGQPAQGGGFGGAPKPSPRPPQSPGFQNQTANKQWWGGGAPSPQGATSGYGGYTPTPAPPPTAPPEDTGGGGGSPGTPAAPAAPKTNPQQPYIDSLQRRLLAAQNRLQQVMQNKTYNMDTGQYYYSMKQQMSVSSAQQEVVRLQGELREAQLKAQQGGY